MKEQNVRIAGVDGTLACPDNPGQMERKSLVLILHGLGGHRDYCYQKLLGQQLPSRLGLYTYRFDFRNCGESDPVPDPDNIGRTVSDTDYDDVDAVVSYFISKGFNIEAMVGHSRGNMTMLVWALRNPEKSRQIGALINCSGRYVSMEHYTNALHAYGSQILWDGGYYLTARRYGAYEPQWIPNYESQEYAYHDSRYLQDIPPEIDILTIFGTKDQVVPVRDAAYWSNLFKGRHTLAMVRNADHNFYGRVPGQAKKITYAPEVVDIITNFLRPDIQALRFARHVATSSEILRWPDIEGVANFRDVGGYPGTWGSIQPRKLFRSGFMRDLTLRGIHTLQELGIKYIIDFRSPEEAKDAPTPHISGIKMLSAPVSQRNFSPDALVERYKDIGGSPGFMRAYAAILKTAGPAYKLVFELLRDNPNGGVVVHCTAGKDRTGVFCALTLLLLGVSPQTVSREYELTTHGLEPIRSELLAHGSHLSAEDREHILSSRYESMMLVIKYIETTYGGAEGYLKSECSLSDDDLSKIRDNLIGRENPTLQTAL